MLRQYAVEWPPALEKLRLPLQIPYRSIMRMIYTLIAIDYTSRCYSRSVTFISITEAMIAIITHAEEERERARGAVDSSLQ